MSLDYYCKTHNILCCAACIAKIKGRGNGQHKKCEICFIEKIKNIKQNSLNKNIEYLKELSEDIEKKRKN